MALVDSFNIRQQNDAADFALAIGMGVKPGMSGEVKFGRYEAVDGVGDIWEGYLYQPEYIFMADTGEAIKIASTDLLDVGTTIKIVGLDINGDVQVESMVLNGLAELPVPGIWRAVNRAFVDSSQRVVGAVLITRVALPEHVYAVIFPEEQQTLQIPYVIPRGKTLLGLSVFAAMNKAGGAEVEGIFRLRTREPGKIFRTRGRFGLLNKATSSSISVRRVPIVLPELTQVRILAETSEASDISVDFSFVLIDNDISPLN